jgi:flagellar assembly protein FliH
LITFLGRTPAAAEVENEARAAIDAGYQRGYSEGLAAAAAEINLKSRQLEERIVALSSVARQLARPLERLDDAAAGELARLAISVGSQLARRELMIDPAQVMRIIRECLVELPIAQRGIRIHLHPADAMVVREQLRAGGSDDSWVLVEDISVGRGGARVIVESSQIDASLDNRVATVAQIILKDARGTVTGDVTADLAAEEGAP